MTDHAATDADRHGLATLAWALARQVAFCGLAVSCGGQRRLAIAHKPFVQADAQTMFRVASVSKIVVGQTLARLLAEKGIGWDTDVSDLLGWNLRNPACPQVPITVGAVTSHSAGLDDAAGYLVPPDISIRDFFSYNRFAKNQNKARFAYSNLGYVVLAEVIESLSGQSLQQASAPLIPDCGGFNWAGVSADRLAQALPTFRREADRFVPQIDSPPVPAATQGNVARFSPQGGLRLSLSGMLELAEGLARADRTVLWHQQDGPGDYLDGVFQHYGAGLEIFDRPTFYPRPLIGHFGNAYGFNGGVWYDGQADLAFAYALNGLEMGDEDDRFSDDERAIFDAVAGIGDD
ncbi:serine hydrolase domain-containing protein [Yoonia sp.]|uniref:serine hydrolase domain-containing protein n=1 Tax=Yoonia sp. TaxID=2212373 RepID=UPI002FDAE89C